MTEALHIGAATEAPRIKPEWIEEDYDARLGGVVCHCCICDRSHVVCPGRVMGPAAIGEALAFYEDHDSCGARVGWRRK